MSRSKDKILSGFLDCWPLSDIHVHTPVVSVEEVVVVSIVISTVHHQSLHVIRTVIPEEKTLNILLGSVPYLMLTQGSS